MRSSFFGKKERKLVRRRYVDFVAKNRYSSKERARERTLKSRTRTKIRDRMPSFFRTHLDEWEEVYWMLEVDEDKLLNDLRKDLGNGNQEIIGFLRKWILPGQTRTFLEGLICDDRVNPSLTCNVDQHLDPKDVIEAFISYVDKLRFVANEEELMRASLAEQGEVLLSQVQGKELFVQGGYRTPDGSVEYPNPWKQGVRRGPFDVLSVGTLAGPLAEAQRWLLERKYALCMTDPKELPDVRDKTGAVLYLSSVDLPLLVLSALSGLSTGHSPTHSDGEGGMDASSGISQPIKSLTINEIIDWGMKELEKEGRVEYMGRTWMPERHMEYFNKMRKSVRGGGSRSRLGRCIDDMNKLKLIERHSNRLRLTGLGQEIVSIEPRPWLDLTWTHYSGGRSELVFRKTPR